MIGTADRRELSELLPRRGAFKTGERLQCDQRTTRAGWRLARSYWSSEERWSAWGFLIAVVALNLGNVYISVQINEWNKVFEADARRIEAHG